MNGVYPAHLSALELELTFETKLVFISCSPDKCLKGPVVRFKQ